jgi:hypothetical protein
MPLSTIIGVNKEYTEVIKSGQEFVKSITMPTDGNYYYASGPIDQLGNETDNYISTLQWVVLCCCAVVCVCACACMCANTDLMIYVP